VKKCGEAPSIPGRGGVIKTKFLQAGHSRMILRCSYDHCKEGGGRREEGGGRREEGGGRREEGGGREIKAFSCQSNLY
jgi:hypothetical protein